MQENLVALNINSLRIYRLSAPCHTLRLKLNLKTGQLKKMSDLGEFVS